MAAPMKNVKPTGKLVFEKSSFNNDKEKHRKCIGNHTFNSSIHILLPEREDMPADIDSLLCSEMAYMARQVPVSLLLDQDFIAGFVKAGSMYMLSHGTCIDQDDCVALLPTGMLILNLCKDTYEQLGLHGRTSTAAERSGKFVVEIDLCGKQFIPGTKYFDRVKWSLTDRLKLNFDFIITWKPRDETVCPSSVQNFFKSKNFLCNRLKINKRTTKFTNFRVPEFSSTDHQPISDNNCESCDYEEVFEWLGACALGIDMSCREADDFVSSFSCPCPNKEVSHGIGVQYTAMYSTQTIQAVTNQLRVHIKTKKLPWCSITVHGFMDSPVAWQHDHGFHRNGDNLYTLLLFENGDYWQYSAVGLHDTCP